MPYCVYSDTIEAKFSDVILYPLDQVSVYELDLLVQIRQSMKPTVLQLPFTLPVFYQTIRMVILRLVERYHLAKVHILYKTYMVHYNIDHHKQSFRVCSIY